MTLWRHIGLNLQEGFALKQRKLRLFKNIFRAMNDPFFVGEKLVYKIVHYTRIYGTNHLMIQKPFRLIPMV